jgi:hypothetical protein
MGRTGGHHWGDSTAAYGENPMAAVNPNHGLIFARACNYSIPDCGLAANCPLLTGVA